MVQDNALIENLLPQNRAAGEFAHSYRLKTEPAIGEAVARVGKTVVARSRNAVVMHETRLEDAVYFPAADCKFLAPDQSDHRTFCPFKGTAVYYDLDLPAGRLSKAAWAYPKALEEASDIEGFIAFNPDYVTVSGHDSSAPDADGHISSPFVDWLLREAWLIEDPQDLTRQIAERLVEAGVAIRRLNTLFWALHPEYAGVSYLWRRLTGEVTSEAVPHEMANHPDYTNSPLHHVANGLGGVRQLLDGRKREFNFPILDELKAKGATDYVAMPLPFSDGKIHVLTLASDHPDGFTTANLGMIFECSAMISRLYEVHLQRANAKTLLSTYLGKRTGERVLAGEIRRGEGEDIEAAVLYCDLRGSTRLSEALPREQYLGLLNRFYEAVGDAVADNDGEVLKFIGDAVLAAFSDHDGDADREACARARKAAVEAAEAISRILLDESSGDTGETLDCAIGCAYGSVSYGNVGSRDRLDFTVTGQAANLAERLCEMAKLLGHNVVVSGTLAERAPDGLASLGHHDLRNVAGSVEIYAVGG